MLSYMARTVTNSLLSNQALFLHTPFSFFRATPDGTVKRSCHGPGV